VRKPPSLRNNNGVIQLRVRVDGVDRFINRLGRFQDAVAVAKAQSLSAKIWEDFCSGNFDPTLDAYQPITRSNGDQPLLIGVREYANQSGYQRVMHTQRLLEDYGSPVRSRVEVESFLAWMERRGLAPRTRLGVMAVLVKVQPHNQALKGLKIRVPHRSIELEVMTRNEVMMVLSDLKLNEQWYYPIFSVWAGTGLRNSEIIGLTWDAIRWEEKELLITKSLKRVGNSTCRRQWASTKTGRHRVIPISGSVLGVLKEHKQKIMELGLYEADGLVFLSPRSHHHLYEHLLEKVWRRSLKRCGVRYRRLYSLRHTFLSHTLAAGNSPADVASIAGHRIEILLGTYAKPTGNLKLIEWV
jgi:integrase